jgi:peptidylprolyl isomerase
LDGPGYLFPNEIDPTLDHGRAGMLGMANSGPHTNGSQFYITLADRSYLDGDYAVFGRVLDGMDVVKAIVQGDKILSVKIVRAGEAAEKFRPTTESFLKLVEEARVRAAEAEAAKKTEEEDIVIKNWPQAISLENGLRYLVLREGSGGIPQPGAKLKVSYTGRFFDGTVFQSTADGGKPDFLEAPEAFEYIAGANRINPGFDDTLLRMRKGEKRLVIIPSNLAYGTGGFYAPEKKGRKRFHISPNTTLVYEIELLDAAFLFHPEPGLVRIPGNLTCTPPV